MGEICIDCDIDYIITNPKRKYKRCNNCYNLHKKLSKENSIKKHTKKHTKKSNIDNRILEYPSAINNDVFSIIITYLDAQTKYNIYKLYGNIFKTKCDSCSDIAKYCSITLDNIDCNFCDEILSKKGIICFSCKKTHPKCASYKFDEITNTDEKYVKNASLMIDKDECSKTGRRQMYDVDYEQCLIY